MPGLTTTSATPFEHRAGRCGRRHDRPFPKATQRARHHPPGCHARGAVQTDIRLEVAYLPVRHIGRLGRPASVPRLE